MKSQFLASGIVAGLGFAVALASISSAATLDLQPGAVKQRYSGIFELRDQDQFKDVNDLDPYRRRSLDLKTIEAELELQFNPRSKFEFEIEFEHGGAGTAMEYDVMEEFGEFESEIEKGGEVNVEEAFYSTLLTPSTELIIGKAPVRVSLTATLRKPLMYWSAMPSLLEDRMIPVEWAEPGLQVRQNIGDDVTARAGIVAGLNSEFFRKYNWIGGGYQRQFEDVSFDDPAYFATLEYGHVAKGRGVAASYYTGNTTHNRRKKDKLTKDANVYLWSLFGQWHVGRVGVMGQYLRGDLQNSEDVVNANITLGGLAAPKSFGSIGARAVLSTLQLSYEFIDDWTLFGQWEHVNTFDRIQGSVFANPRYDVRQLGGGLAHRWEDVCTAKFQMFKEWTHLEGLPSSTTYLAQFAFDTGLF